MEIELSTANLSLKDRHRLHLIAPFHVVPSTKYSACAFVSKVRKYSSMIRSVSDEFEIVEYSNGESESEAHIHVKILDESELPAAGNSSKEFWGDTAVIQSPHWKKFDDKLKVELRKRYRSHDIICYPFGNSHPDLPALFPDAIHTEAAGIGYPNAFSNFRVYESSAWLHHTRGKENKMDGNFYDTVIPNYYDVEVWRYNPTPKKNYVLFYGRIVPDKGLEAVACAAKLLPQFDFVICGQGDPKQWLTSPNISYHPPVTGADCWEIVSNAYCVLTPTYFIEPFCGVHAEANMCGVPVITSNRGVFWETIEEGFNGYICRTVGDIAAAIVAIGKNGMNSEENRKAISEYAHHRFGFETCGKKYVSYLKDLIDLFSTKGWYHHSSNHYMLDHYSKEQLENEKPAWKQE